MRFATGIITACAILGSVNAGNKVPRTGKIIKAGPSVGSGAEDSVYDDVPGVIKSTEPAPRPAAPAAPATPAASKAELNRWIKDAMAEANAIEVATEQEAKQREITEKQEADRVALEAQQAAEAKEAAYQQRKAAEDAAKDAAKVQKLAGELRREEAPPEDQQAAGEGRHLLGQRKPSPTPERRRRRRSAKILEESQRLDRLYSRAQAARRLTRAAARQAERRCRRTSASYDGGEVNHPGVNRYVNVPQPMPAYQPAPVAPVYQPAQPVQPAYVPQPAPAPIMAAPQAVPVGVRRVGVPFGFPVRNVRRGLSPENEEYEAKGEALKTPSPRYVSKPVRKMISFKNSAFKPVSTAKPTEAKDAQAKIQKETVEQITRLIKANFE
ncbi:predicted protein [Verticillium alfalfae VaMs.102]|uniref:Predicted protein n=1 Tax=Verticillium alfalfae (strain VaMs.102 / ATCC MYA-4576 / FGSC 10136) TaxID=526221 RepID=C9S9U1_VERA1|nr:predicted protein [Verticillium alfalfae VaMs.102]EEY16154.1 predicted protein [Verticillium alfalfae VaMs.102]